MKEPEVVENEDVWDLWRGVTTDRFYASIKCRVTIDNSWVNPAKLSKEVQRMLKIQLEEVQQNAKEKGTKARNSHL